MMRIAGTILAAALLVVGALSAHADEGEVSAPVSETMATPTPIDVQGCAAVAIDRDTGAEGNGRGATLAAAREDALAVCRGDGAKSCEVVSASCNPDGN
ncbi:MAG: DUF4189 domain-containing protein [Pseudomonadota bacterium]